MILELPFPVHPDVAARVRAVLAEASVVAEGKASSPDGGGSHASEPDYAPRWAGSLHDELLASFRRSESPAVLARRVDEAERRLRERKRGPMVRPLSVQQQVLVLEQGQDSADVARRYGVSRRTVWRWRASAGQAPDGAWSLTEAARRMA